MEIVKNRYGTDRVIEKIGDTKIRIMGESLFTRGSQDDDGNQTMFDFEGGPCLNIGGKVAYRGMEFKILSIQTEQSKIEDLASVLLEVTL
tara:strand:+ start:3584 stop:3853 length:270 start_codon:yes stop_codon:yes gene_type:complete